MKSPSMSGDNMHAVECAQTSRCASYAVCQHTVWAYKQSRLKGFDDCRAAINSRTCPAIKMMLEEKKAGGPIYFESYAESVVARQAREEAAAAERVALTRRPRKAMVTSRTVDPGRDAQIAAGWNEADDTVAKRLAKQRKSKPELPPVSDNLFEAVVNELAAQEASSG